MKNEFWRNSIEGGNENRASYRPLFVLTSIFVVFLLLIGTAERVSGQSFFEIDGQIEVTDYQWLRRSKGNPNIPDEQWSFQFKCISGIGFDLWRIDENAILGGKEKMYFDGTNSYKFLRQTNSTPNPFPYQTPGAPLVKPFDRNDDNATIQIHADSKAPIDGIGINIPWLAFCSGNYLKCPGRVVPLLTANRGLPDAFAYTDVTETFPDPLGLPKRVDLFTSQERAMQSATNLALTQTPFVQRYQLHIPSRSDGILRSHYETISVTNYDGCSFPSEFVFIVYMWDSAGNMHEDCSGTGRLTAIRKAKKPANIFGLAKNQGVIDWRFKRLDLMIEAISYQWTNPVSAPSIGDPRLRAILDSEIRKAKERR